MISHFQIFRTVFLQIRIKDKHNMKHEDAIQRNMNISCDTK